MLCHTDQGHFKIVTGAWSEQVPGQLPWELGPQLCAVLCSVPSQSLHTPSAHHPKYRPRIIECVPLPPFGSNVPLPHSCRINQPLFLDCDTFHISLTLYLSFCYKHNWTLSLSKLVNFKGQFYLSLNPQTLREYMRSSLYSVNVYWINK